MEDTKKIKMGDDQKKLKWKTTKKSKMEDEQQQRMDRRPKNSKWKTTKKMEDKQKNKNGR